MKKRKIVHLIAPGYSGSTLLSHVLGAHSQILNIGEYLHAIQREKKVECRICDKTCPVWGIFTYVQLTAYIQNFNFSEFGRGKQYKRILVDSLNHHLPNFKGPAYLHKKLFEHTGTEIILDASKDIKYALYTSRNANYEHFYVFLIRDFRALVASRMRKFKEDIKTAGTIQFNKINTRVLFFPKLDSPNKLLLKYEDFVQNPERELSRLLTMLNLDFEPSMLKYYNFPQHTLGGSLTVEVQRRIKEGVKTEDLNFEGKDYYVGADKKLFKLDERWKSELSEEQINEFDKLYGDFNKSHGYF